ncbi:hypothetical protein A3J61_02145 [Candidatus Nomurabacteria bacterium RIFCSPHIGHO2_02_FULL_38_15]|uniref:Asn/Gln amidotransferase domain-containing protein n=1 Tax=Candidatus Nomurabacteria bacterium RIFCSPHIGHO2_02_FULL_38_15 TaxID=1801752 RepID=A0A1F6VS39_9BACT|nr:MAG: hypothetical protein A3J61_02145 [Candidatus Nomurabacteria bacterium RIFCSPHIGHO2_02_FULL_38_15]
MNMFKNFLMKKMLKNQLKKAGLPEAEQERIIAMVLKNPDLFQKIGNEIQEKIRGGMNQQTATMRVMEKYKPDLKDIMG